VNLVVVWWSCQQLNILSCQQLVGGHLTDCITVKVVADFLDGAPICTCCFFLDITLLSSGKV
jgi:hypothetical protein